VDEALQPYSEYKQSRLPWAPEIPRHWELVPNRALLRRRKALVGKEHFKFQLLSLTKGGVIVRDISTSKGKFSADMGTSQEVRSGDFIFCLFDIPETPRTVGLSKHHGMITSAYTLFEPRNLTSTGARYLEQFYIAMDDRKLLSPLYSGLRNTIPPSRFLGIKTPQPPSDEQAAIVRFLGHANGNIGRFIRAKRKLILLLIEQKQAIIHRAITRGLNPHAPFKSSGISWLGDIPEHWEVRPIKQLLARMDYGISESSIPNGNIRVLTMGHIRDGHVIVPEFGGVNDVPAVLVLQPDDLLFNRTNSPELVGKVGIFKSRQDTRITFASYLVRLRVRAEHSPHWMNYVLNSFRFWAYARSQAFVSLHQANLNSSRYGRMGVPVPPREEQDGIVSHIEESASEIDTAIARTEREIALVQEYRARLTSDVVTGKLDVRVAAAQLPEIAPEDVSVIESQAANQEPALEEADE
jgi:type I restriction enzyme S subunit